MKSRVVTPRVMHIHTNKVLCSGAPSLDMKGTWSEHMMSEGHKTLPMCKSCVDIYEARYGRSFVRGKTKPYIKTTVPKPNNIIRTLNWYSEQCLSAKKNGKGFSR